MSRKRGLKLIKRELVKKASPEKDRSASSQYTNDLQRENAEEPWRSKIIKKK